MKISNVQYLLFFFLSSSIFLLFSCDQMDDIQKEFIEEAEIVYLGRLDSLDVVPGYNRVKLKWEVSADPRIDFVKIFWNDRKDSTSISFERKLPGRIKDSIIIDGLSEGEYTFELLTENERGEFSLPSYISGNVWGANRTDELGMRSINLFNWNNSENFYELRFSSIRKRNAEDSLVFTEIFYNDLNKIEQRIILKADSSTIILNNFPEGEDFNVRDVFVSSGVMDTLFGNYRKIKGQNVKNEKLVQIESSKVDYESNFIFDDSNFYEWTEIGELIKFMITKNGEMTDFINIESPKFSRNEFRNLFYYQDNNFVGVTHEGDIYQYQMVNDTMYSISDDEGNDVLGTGFDFDIFFRGVGFFYTVSSSGDLNIWNLQNNGDWGSPNGTLIASGFDIYETLNFSQGELLAIDFDGFLWNISLNADGSPDVLTKIGEGFMDLKNIMTMGDNVIGVSKNSEFYIFDKIDNYNYLIIE